MGGGAADGQAGTAGKAAPAGQAERGQPGTAGKAAPAGQAGHGQPGTGRPRRSSAGDGSGDATEGSGLELLLALSAVPTAVLSRDGDIVDVNDAFCAWSGHGAEQLAGMRIHDLLDPSEHAGFDHDLERLGRPGAAGRRARAERTVMSAVGRRIWAIVDLVAVPSAAEPPALVSQWTDVTELRDHEERQRESALEDGEIVSFVSALVRADDPAAVITEAAARVAAVIGDACAVFRAEGTTRLREFTWQSRRPDALDPDRPLTTDVRPGTRSGPLARVLRSGRRVAELSADPTALRAQLPPQFRRPLDLFGVSSAVFVPVRVFGAVAGVVVAYRFAGSPAYTVQALVFLDEFGVHASLAFERAELNDRLRQSDEHFQACLNTVLDAVAVLRSVRDEAGAIVDFEWVHINDAGCRLNGRPGEEIVGQRLLAAHPTSRDTTLFAEFREVTESGRTLAKSGSRYDSNWFGGRSVPRVFDLRAARLGDGFVLAWRDVTEQLEHVAALERYARHNEVLAAVSAAFSRAGSDLTGVVAAVVRQLVTHLADFAGIALLSSDATRLDSAIAFAAGSDGGLPAKGLATTPIPLAAEGPHQRAFHTGQPVVRNQLDDDGRLDLTPEHDRLIEHLTTRALYVPLRAGSGTIGVLTLARTGPRDFSDDDIALAADVADRAALAIDSARLSSANEEAHRTLRASEAELRRSNHDLEQFAYVISHDLQAPLRTVRGYIDLVARKLAQRSGGGDPAGGDRSVDDYLRAITSGVSRMQDLIRGLLAYSRVGSLIDDPAPVDTNVLMGNVLAALRSTIESAGATVTHDPLPTVAVDGWQFEQLLQNLIENAIKFRGVEAPVVHVSAWREPGVWAFSVTDNGIGLDPAHSERIFEVFHRLHPVDRYPGAGIGLAIGNKIVQRHGGAMRVVSSPGRGATFSFTIPDRAAGG